METLNERLTAAFHILIENRVFFDKYNKDAFCKSPDEQLNLLVNYLSEHDIRIIISVCDLFSLKFGIFYAPSLNGNDLCVTFKDKESNHG